ncbi:hypothetical protein GALL_357410 [mine drainage metagenome]|uniref:Uncharacterized protein n=1 Tax=mine drainage metagenome TaxID=410659 RepID=A0A1J5QG78_9ZZZZ
MDGLNGVAHAGRELRDLEAGIGRISASVIKEVADIVRPEHGYQTLVLDPALFQTLEFVAAGAEGAAGGVA